MKTVYLFGTAKDQALSFLLRTAFSARGGTMYISGRGICIDGAQPAFLLCETEHFPQIEPEEGIFALKAGTKTAGRLRIPPGFVAVADADSVAALTLLERQHAAAVTCGLSSFDTVTLSSRNGSAAVVSVQRPIAAPGDVVVEPCEIPVNLAEGEEPYTVMAACAILLMCGVPESEVLL